MFNSIDLRGPLAMSTVDFGTEPFQFVEYANEFSRFGRYEQI
jgi:hypothetical protein